MTGFRDCTVHVDIRLLQLAEAQEFVDEMRDLIRKITTLRQNLTGTSYMRYHSYSAVAFSTKDMNYLESLTTTVRRQILVVYHAIQALKAEFPDYTSNGPIAELSERETALMKKELNHLYSTYADRLDTIEARAEVEEKEIEDGTSDKRFEKIIEDKEPGMQHEEILKQLKEARALQRSTNINKLQVSRSHSALVSVSADDAAANSHHRSPIASRSNFPSLRSIDHWTRLIASRTALDLAPSRASSATPSRPSSILSWVPPAFI